MAKCHGKKASGEPCRGDAMPGLAYCWAHDPKNADARRRNATRGGKSGGRGRVNADLTEIKEQLKAMLDDVLSGRILPGIASVANQVENTRLRAVEVERKLREQDELEARLEALEERYQEQGQQPQYNRRQL